MCWQSGEMVDHLLICCDVAYDLWSLVLEPLGSGGCYQGMWLIFCLGGGIGLGGKIWRFGTLYRYA